MYHSPLHWASAFGWWSVEVLACFGRFSEQQHRQCTYNVTRRHIHATIDADRKVISITYSEFVFVDLGIWHTMHMRRIFACGLFGSTVFFHNSSQKARLQEKRFLNVNFFLSEKVLVLRRVEQIMIKNVYWSSCKVSLFLWDFSESWIFWTDFWGILKY